MTKPWRQTGQLLGQTAPKTTTGHAERSSSMCRLSGQPSRLSARRVCLVDRSYQLMAVLSAVAARRTSLHHTGCPNLLWPLAANEVGRSYQLVTVVHTTRGH
jgi:hypothetical protein